MDRTKHLLLFVLTLIILTPFTSFSQLECALPPPDEIWANDITNDHLDIAWNSVAEAVYYRVEVVDYNTQETLLLFDTEENFLFLSLALPNEIVIAVSAAGCWEGNPGGSRIFGWPPNGGIAFDDVILERESPTDPNYEYTHCSCLAYTKADPNSNNGLHTITNLHTQFVDRTRFRVTNFLQSNTYGAFAMDNPHLSQLGNLTSNTTFSSVNSSQLSGTATGASSSYFDATYLSQGIATVATAGAESAGVDASRCFCRTARGAVSYFTATEGDNDIELRDRESNLVAGVFPNPARELVQINLPASGQVQIIDLSGRIWWHQEAAKRFNLDISAWPAGQFWVRYSGTAETATYRFTKQ